jgi:hypothetical protein
VSARGVYGPRVRCSRRAWALLSILVGACALPQRTGRDGRDLGADLATPAAAPDLAGAAAPPDFAGVDLTGVDLTSPSPVADLAPTSCDPVAQAGCNLGEKCTLGAAADICVTDGTQPRGAACGAAGADECIAGNVCVHETASVGACRAFCRTDSDCKQPAAPGGAKNVAHCLIPLTGGGTVKACTLACDPVAGTCGAGLTCRYQGTPSIPELTECGLAGNVAVGMPCSKQEDCAAALSCSTVNGSQKCRKVCHAGSTTDCPGGVTCAAPSIASPMFGLCYDGT